MNKPDYFTPDMHRLIEQYAELLALIFMPEDFYDWECITLAVMPPPEAQTPLLATFRTRLIQVINQAQQAHESLTLAQAERLVWKQIEEALILQKMQKVS